LNFPPPGIAGLYTSPIAVITPFVKFFKSDIVRRSDSFKITVTPSPRY
jgi:hypothetical protein